MILAGLRHISTSLADLLKPWMMICLICILKVLEEVQYAHAAKQNVILGIGLQEPALILHSSRNTECFTRLRLDAF